MFYETLKKELGPEYSPLRPPAGALQAMRETFEREFFLYVFRRARGNKLYMARMIGCNRNTIRKFVNKYGFKVEDLPTNLLR